MKLRRKSNETQPDTINPESWKSEIPERDTGVIIREHIAKVKEAQEALQETLKNKKCSKKEVDRAKNEFRTTMESVKKEIENDFKDECGGRA